MSAKLKYLPNCITALRIVGTAALIFTKPMSIWFYIVYCLTGITDVLDGFIARKFKLTSEFGAKLDSIADLLFYTVMGIMIMPVLLETLPLSLWCGVITVIALRLASYITAAIKFKRFASTHSILNKLTGAAVFSIPFILLLSFEVPICWVICIISGVSSSHELVTHLSSKTYKTKVRG